MSTSDPRPASSVPGPDGTGPGFVDPVTGRAHESTAPTYGTAPLPGTTSGTTSGTSPEPTGTHRSGPGHTGPGHDTTTPAEPVPAGSRALRPSDVRTSGGTDPAFPEAQGPRTTGPGGHVLGVLVGLVLTVVGLAVTALGMSRILAANGVGADAVAIDGLGVALVFIGGLLLYLVALLAVRTSAVPITGGLVALVVGAAFLFAPAATHRETVRLLATEQNTDAVLNTLTVFVLGLPFVVGLVLLGAGTASSLVRRRGIAVGSYRERTQAARSAR